MTTRPCPTASRTAVSSTRRLALCAALAAALPGVPLSPTLADQRPSPDGQITFDGPAPARNAFHGSQAHILQIGDGHLAGLEQLGHGNGATIQQLGGSNTVWLYQRSSPGSAGTNGTAPGQSPSHTSAVGAQALYSGKLSMSVFQNGVGNRAQSLQAGERNNGLIAQSGDHNSAFLVQFGSAHSASIVQHGSHLNATSIQTGAGSTPVSIYQSGSGAPSVVVTTN